MAPIWWPGRAAESVVRRLSGSEDEAADQTALTFERALAKLHM